MAENKSNVTKPSDKVVIRLPLLHSANAPQEEFYSVNFKNYIIKRGVDVEVPKELAETIRAQQEAEDKAYRYAIEHGVNEPKM